MSNPRLAIGAYRYDNMRALFDGSVTIDGVDADLSTAKIASDIFKRMIREREFDVSELGWTYYLRTLDFNDPPFIALPVFPNRQFRHSAIYINTSGGITQPQDLAGKNIGEFAIYGHDPGVWQKGILSDEYGVTPEQCRWVIGGLDWPMAPIDFIPFLHPSDVDVTRAPEGKELGQMLDDGEIDALISADVPQCILADSPRVARLFPDYERVERDYFERTGIYPAMHTVVARKELADERPELIRNVYEAFCDSKDAAGELYRNRRIFNNMDQCMVPWFSRLLDENRRFFPENWFPYGVEANRAMVDTFLRYHYEQGLSKHRLTCEDVFVPELLDT